MKAFNTNTTRQQLLPFAFVGLFSTATHLCLVALLVHFLQLKPLIANVMAYLVTVNISYLGHRYITFAKLGANRQLRLPHYLVISLIAFLLNEFLYFLFLHFLPFNYFISLIIVIILVAIFTFVASKLWACR